MGYSDQSEYPKGIFFVAGLSAATDVPTTGEVGLKVSAIIVSDTVNATVTVSDGSGTVMVINCLANDTTTVEQGFTGRGQLAIVNTAGTPDVTVLYRDDTGNAWT